MKVLIIGAGGHGQVVADIFLAGLSQEMQSLECGRSPVQPIGFLDDNANLHQRSLLGLPVLGGISQLPVVPHDAVFVAIGDNRIRQRICDQLESQGERLVSAIHPSAIIGSDVSIGVGTVVSAGAVINVGSRIGQGVILNTACTVDHHDWIGDYAHVAPGAHLGGDVEVGEGTLVGIGATILPQRQIGVWSIVGAGAVVTRNIPSYVTAVGVPARAIVPAAAWYLDVKKPELANSLNS